MIEKYGPERILRRRRVRLGSERADRRPEVRDGDAPAPSSRVAHPAGGLREPGPVPEPVAEVPCAGRRRADRRPRGSADGRAAVQIDPSGFLHLTYCTNIHAGRRVARGRSNLRQLRAGAQAALSPDAPVRHRPAAVGARRARAARRHASSDFKAFLDARGSTSPSSTASRTDSFHRHGRSRPTSTRPTGATRRASQYTLDLIDDPEPAAARRAWTAASRPRRCRTRPWMREARRADWATHHAQRRARGRGAGADAGRRSGRHDPSRHRARARLRHRDHRRGHRVLRAAAAARRGRRNSPRPRDATRRRPRRHLLEHIRVCFDCCHFAVEYEDPIAALDALARRGHPDRPHAAQLGARASRCRPTGRGAAGRSSGCARFADSTYLHQVIERRDGALEHYPDLDDALRDAATGGDRVAHPLSRAAVHRATTTAWARRRTTCADVLAAARDRRDHAPPRDRDVHLGRAAAATLKIDLLDSIGREYDWVLGRSWFASDCTGSADIRSGDSDERPSLDEQDRRPQRRRPDAEAARPGDAAARGVGRRRSDRPASSPRSRR